MMAEKLKHRWSLGHNYLAGITAGTWWRLLSENQFSISPAYWHRAAFITLASIANSYYWRKERGRYDDVVKETRIKNPPLFILGHWRSGTTLLHYLLAQDTSRFNFANTYQVVNPLTFLTTEKVNTRRFAGLVPPTRPMDNMKLSFATPQEDEFAPLLTTLLSPYLGISFPSRFDHYARYLTFRDASEEERLEWKKAFVWFCKKFVWPPMINAMQERQNQIADGLAAAEKGQQAQQVAEQEAAQLISEAKSQAAEIIANAEKRGSSVVDDAKTAATSEKERIIASAQAEVEQDVHSAREALRSQVSSIAVAAAGKIVDKEIDEAAHAGLLDDLVKQLKAG